MENWTNAKLCDVANLILGAVLFVSPWTFSSTPERFPTTPMLPVSSSRPLRSRRGGIRGVGGVAEPRCRWALVSSWVLGFQGTTAMTVHVIIGAAAAILAAIELWMTSQIPPRLTTGR